ncbi:hypothetical protein [Streptomyces phaeochromogenes]|uniref:hypothetical protein n=1 Tax=Streptomyces phaeochromogenes TaxID=1923 RepID=UPI0038698C04|nr:hypothetical protein OG277_08565 [Streptomyces phaeochromogenes]
MSDETKLIAAFEEMRRGEGVTPTKLGDRPWLLDLLSTPGDPIAGQAVLDQAINDLGDRRTSRAVRNALNVNMEWHGELDDRRKWATGVEFPEGGLFLGVSRGTHYKLEREGFPELAELLLNRAVIDKVETKSSDPFLGSAQKPLDEEDDCQSPATEEPAAPTRTLRVLVRRRHLAVLAIACLGATAIIALAVWDGETDKKATKPSTTASPVTIPVSDLDHTSTKWGPERKMYSVDKPAPYAAFNSLVDAYDYGDEREFLLCHDKEEKEVKERRWDNRIAAEDGHYYDCGAWFSNAVAPNLDKGNSAAQLHDARAEILVPPKMPVYNPGLVAQFTADNAPKVWATCNFVAEKPLNIYYIPGSSFLTTRDTKKKYGAKGLPMSDEARHASSGGIAEPGGALIGDNKQDGIVRQASGWVQFTILVEFADKTG